MVRGVASGQDELWQKGVSVRLQASLRLPDNTLQKARPRTATPSLYDGVGEGLEDPIQDVEMGDRIDG